MSVQDQIRTGVQRALQDQDAAQIEACQNNDRVKVAVRSAGPIGVSVDSIEVDRSGLNAEDARHACEELEERVHYLMEPLRVIESDTESGVTQVRSDTPTSDEAGRHYYEVTGQAGRLDMKRYQKPDDGPRQQEPMDLTHQQLERLTEDLMNAGRDQKRRTR